MSHVFLKKFCLPSLSAGVIVSVVGSSCMVEVGGMCELPV